MDQVRVIKRVLNNFCASSGQIVSDAKTLVCFSKNVAKNKGKLLGEALGFTVSSNLGKYLGVPLLHTRVNGSTYSDIVEKVNKRLSGWNASSLSLVGRVTLANTVLQTIPYYSMQSTSLPVSVCNKIERACRSLFGAMLATRGRLSLLSGAKCVNLS